VRSALFALFAVACAPEPAADDVAPVRAALGQPMGDYPSYEERVVLYGTNRARVAPTVEGWPSYPAQPPMQWNYDLNRAARAHSTDMRDTPCFQHNSCDGTETFTRVLSYYKGPWSTVSENIAAGVMDPLTVVRNWINEVGAPAGETGHRDSIFSSKLTLIGCGFAAGGTSRTPNYWTQDFVGTNVARPRLTDGIHFPRTAAAGGTITFGTTFYDAAFGSAAPQVFVVVDGVCRALSQVRGSATLGAHEAAIALADGCHPYYFVATKGDGVALATYPDAGALQVGTGAAACPLFTATRAEVACGGAASGAAGTGGGAAGTGGGTGAAGTGPVAGTSGGATGVAGEVGGQGAFGCAVAPGARSLGACLVVALAALGLARRRRRASR
jgi:hypothetical protein